MTSKTISRKNTMAAPFAPIGHAVVALVLEVRRLVVAIKHRRDLARLTDSDDRMLADIGLRRSDLRDACSATGVAVSDQPAGASRRRRTSPPAYRPY